MRTRIAWLAAAVALTAAACKKETPYVSAKDIPAVVAQLSSSRDATRVSAETRLSHTPPEATWPALIPVLEDASKPATARAAVVRILARTADVDGIPGVVVRHCADDDPLVRRAALDAVVATANPAHKQVLLLQAQAQKDPARKKELEDSATLVGQGEKAWQIRRLAGAKTAQDRALAARRLGDIGGPGEVPILIEAYGSDSATTLLRQEVLLATANIGGDQAKAFVGGELASPDRFLQSVAAFCEIRLRDPAAVPALGEILAHGSVGDGRASAAKALGVIGSPEAKLALVHGCDEPPDDWRVKKACADAGVTLSRSSKPPKRG